MDRLKGKVAIVSGGARGIGGAISGEFERQGAVVIRADIETHGRADVTPLDVADVDNWRAVVADTVTGHGRVDVLVNNAAAGSSEYLDEISDEEWLRVIQVNQTGTFWGIKHVLPYMTNQGSGSIINISSILGVRAFPGVAAYQVTKAAVLGITRNVAVSYGGRGVRANAIVPGWIRTPSTANQNSAQVAAFLDRTPVPRGGEPQDIAWAAVYLASDEATFVNGIELPVDGGYLAQ